MMKNFLLLFSSCVCSLAYAEQKYDHATSVQVGQVEVSRPVEFQEIVSILGKKALSTHTALLSGCTGNYEVYFEGKSPEAHLEYYPEDNSSKDFQGLEKTPANIRNPKLRARIWLAWVAAKNIRQVVYLNQRPLDWEMKFTEFAHLFPLSAKNPESSPAKETTQLIYNVLFGIDEDAEEQPPYTPSVQFIFKNDQLFRLRITQGVAC